MTALLTWRAFLCSIRIGVAYPHASAGSRSRRRSRSWRELARMPIAAPLLLAVESATPALSCAVLRGEELLCQKKAERGQHHAEAILPQIDAVLASAQLKLEQIEAFAVSIGPGSFTSLRIGLATVKGLAFDTGRPVAPVSTLLALAQTADLGQLGDRPVVAMLDARRDEAYAAAYCFSEDERGNLQVREVISEGVYSPAELATQLEQMSDGCHVLGEGSELLVPHLSRLGAARIDLSPASLPEAAAIGKIGARILASKGGVSAASLSPRYVRRAEAEVLRTARRFED
jgi:tRNA threonylcarbamoyladenosine biosynthesis protein TsaB